MIKWAGVESGHGRQDRPAAFRKSMSEKDLQVTIDLT